MILTSEAKIVHDINNVRALLDATIYFLKEDGIGDPQVVITRLDGALEKLTAVTKQIKLED